MAGVERQRGSSRPGQEKPEAVARPAKQVRATPRPQAALDPVRQEKSLEALGRMLKTKREINGWTRRDMVIKIKIPMDQLEAIEDGRLSLLPPVFAKGFLRAYANELSLDAEAILDDYRKMTGGFKNEPASREPLANRYVETSVGSPAWRPGLRGLAVTVALLAAGALLFGVWPEFRRAVLGLWPTPADTPAETILVQAGGAPPPPTTGSGEAPAGLGPAEAAAPAPREAAVAGGRLAAEAPPPAGSAEAAAPAPGGELTLVSQKDGVWVQIAVDGRPVEHFCVKRGQQVIRKAETGLVIRTGQATALSAAWNGQNLGPLSDSPIAEVTLPPG
ncbi:hypothetical protein FACS189460_5460 [Deltaproteobacteria bacterium]|nr:hypothetical protein FACS189460_5460 [Deltaproteobacteria bacterium]